MNERRGAMSTPPRKKRSSSSRNAKAGVQAAAVSDVRRTARSITRVSDLYGGGETGRLLATDITSSPQLTRKVRRLAQRRHEALGIGDDGVYRRAGHEWKVPRGVRLCMKVPLVWGQVANKYPWAVTWVSPRTGKRQRKYFNTAMAGVHFITVKAQYVDKGACLTSRSVGYDIPAPLRGKIPLPWRWCPHCMTARKFRRVNPQQKFVAQRKEWSDEKQRYIWRERTLALMECPFCRCTNRDTKMRRSNQPWETRRIKAGVSRVRRRRR